MITVYSHRAMVCGSEGARNRRFSGVVSLVITADVKNKKDFLELLYGNRNGALE
jgi:hypothetical protein